MSVVDLRAAKPAGGILSDPTATVSSVKHRDRLARIGGEHMESELVGRRLPGLDPTETTSGLMPGAAT